MRSFFRVSRHATTALLASVLLAACGEKPQAPQPPTEPGVVLVATEPGEAELFINGQHHGRTPAEPGQTLAVPLAPGNYTLEARKAADEFSEWVGRHEQLAVAATPVPPVTLKLERRLTPAGEQARAAEQARLAAREQAIIGAFAFDEAGTATDTRSGLMWMRCSVGQTWTDGSCAGEPKTFSWTHAMKAPDGFRFAGRSDWRMPTREELHSLTYCSSGRRFAFDSEGTGGACEGDYRRPTILEAVFPNTPAGRYWSSTQHPAYSHSAFGVAFFNGVMGAGNKSEYVALRLVRDAR
jgi:hypothetical protein